MTAIRAYRNSRTIKRLITYEELHSCINESVLWISNYLHIYCLLDWSAVASEVVAWSCEALRLEMLSDPLAQNCCARFRFVDGRRYISEPTRPKASIFVKETLAF